MANNDYTDGFTAGDDIVVKLNPAAVPWLNGSQTEQPSVILTRPQSPDTMETLVTAMKEKYPPTAINTSVKLTPNQIYLGGPCCGLYIPYEELKIGAMFITLVLKKEHGLFFELYPGSRYQALYLDVEGIQQALQLYFSGIIFDYQDRVFMVFHVESE